MGGGISWNKIYAVETCLHDSHTSYGSKKKEKKKKNLSEKSFHLFNDLTHSDSIFRWPENTVVRLTLIRQFRATSALASVILFSSEKTGVVG